MAYKNRTGTFTKDQLNSMGVSQKEFNSNIVNGPGAIFPLIFQKPEQLENNPIRDYKIVLKEEFIGYLNECYTSELNSKDENYSTKVANAIEKERKKNIKVKIAYQLMPAELRPNFAKRKDKSAISLKVNKKLKGKEVDIDQKLKILEQKEKDVERGVKVKDEVASDSEKEEEQAIDEEMDDDIDYGNNYFDNGEGYNEEDDNLEDGDGPVY